MAFLSDAGFSAAAVARRFGAAVAVGILGKIGVGLVADRVSGPAAALLTFGAMTAGAILLLDVGRMPGLLPVFLAVNGFSR